MFDIVWRRGRCCETHELDGNPCISHIITPNTNYRLTIFSESSGNSAIEANELACAGFEAERNPSVQGRKFSECTCQYFLLACVRFVADVTVHNNLRTLAPDLPPPPLVRDRLGRDRSCAARSYIGFHFHVYASFHFELKCTDCMIAMYGSE